MKFNTYVINLDSHVARYDAQVVQLQKVGISPIRIKAYRYDDIPDEEIEKHFTGTAPYWTPKSIVACAYSHKMALKTFLGTDTHEVALILEDDAFPLFDDVRFLEEKLNVIDWDILSLHCDGSCDKKSKFYNPGSAAAYFVTRDGAQKILKHKYKDHFDLETNKLDFITKKVDDENSFWADEDAVMSKKISANRAESACPRWLKNLSPFIVTRGEKTLCHIKNYYSFRFPFTDINITGGNLVTFYVMLILALILYFFIL